MRAQLKTFRSRCWGGLVLRRPFPASTEGCQVSGSPEDSRSPVECLQSSCGAARVEDRGGALHWVSWLWGAGLPAIPHSAGCPGGPVGNQESWIGGQSPLLLQGCGRAVARQGGPGSLTRHCWRSEHGPESQPPRACRTGRLGVAVHRALRGCCRSCQDCQGIVVPSLASVLRLLPVSLGLAVCRCPRVQG